MRSTLIDNFRLLILYILFTFKWHSTQCLTYGRFKDQSGKKKGQIERDSGTANKSKPQR